MRTARQREVLAMQGCNRLSTERIYSSTALSNNSWGGLKDVGTLIIAMFTATTGAVAAAAATAGSTKAVPEARAVVLHDGPAGGAAPVPPTK